MLVKFLFSLLLFDLYRSTGVESVVAKAVGEIHTLPFHDAYSALSSRRERNKLVMQAVEGLQKVHAKGTMYPDVELDNFRVNSASGKVYLVPPQNPITKDEFKAQLIGTDKTIAIGNAYFKAKANLGTINLLAGFSPELYIRDLPAPSPKLPSKTFDLSNYKLQEIGRGNYGRVLKATEEGTGRQFAIKEFTDNQQSIQEFQNEANILRNLGLSDGKLYRKPSGYFIIQRYIEGISLSTALKNAATEEERDALIRKAYEEIHRFHQSGYIHSDSNPKNIMIDKEGKMHLIDFGMTVQKSEYLRWLMAKRELNWPSALNVIKVMENRDFAELFYYPRDQL